MTDVHFHQHIGHHPFFGGFLVDGAGDALAVHRLDHIHLAHDAGDLVGLQMPDQMGSDTGQIQRLFLFHILLHTVFAHMANTGVQRRLHTGGIHRFGHPHQRDLPLRSSGGGTSVSDLFLNIHQIVAYLRKGALIV